MKRAAALLTAAATAMTIASVAAAARPDDHAGMLGVGRAAAVTRIVTADDSGRARGPGAIAAVTSGAVRPDDRAAARGPGSFSPQQPVSTSGGGFDWMWRVPLIGAVAAALLACAPDRSQPAPLSRSCTPVSCARQAALARPG
jgi:hypothetical protein